MVQIKTLKDIKNIADKNCPDCFGRGVVSVIQKGKRVKKLCRCVWKKMDKAERLKLHIESIYS